jgi:hypothetical protein
MQKNKAETHYHVHKLGDCLNVRPDPYVVGLRVNSAGRRADDRATWALLGVHLHEIKHPEQMLWAPPPWPELVPNNKLSKDLHDPHACSEELT